MGILASSSIAQYFAVGLGIMRKHSDFFPRYD